MKKNRMNSLVGLAGLLVLSGCFGNDDVEPGIEQQLVRETQIIDEYLQDNQINAEIDTYSSLRYETILEGNGLAPYIANSVNLTYTATDLATGDVVETGENVEIDWEDLVLGLRLGLRNMRESGSMTLYVPSVLAYGETGKNDIPANSILIYDLTLNSFDMPQLKSDITEIQSYLNENEITAVKDPSGIFYVIHETGSGNAPGWSSNILVDYEGRLIESGDVFDSATGRQFNLGNLISGWRIALRYLKEGGSMTMYIPSTFAYGTQGQNGIPSNANLEFDVDLISVN